MSESFQLHERGGEMGMIKNLLTKLQKEVNDSSSRLQMVEEQISPAIFEHTSDDEELENTSHYVKL
jgi:hypothetical protein